MSELVTGVVFAHAGIADGLVGAVRIITGLSDDALLPLSNEGTSPDVLSDELERLTEGGATIVFTDLIGSSCNTLAAILARNQAGMTVISGVNLPMLIEFAFNRHLPIEHLVDRLVQRGREGIQSQGSKPHGRTAVPR